MRTSLEMDPATRVQILDEADGISYNAHTSEKDMNLTTLFPAMSE